MSNNLLYSSNWDFYPDQIGEALEEAWGDEDDFGGDLDVDCPECGGELIRTGPYITLGPSFTSMPYSRITVGPYECPTCDPEYFKKDEEEE